MRQGWTVMEPFVLPGPKLWKILAVTSFDSQSFNIAQNDRHDLGFLKWYSTSHLIIIRRLSATIFDGR